MIGRAQPKPFARWRNPLVVVAAGIVVATAGAHFSHRTRHPLPALSREEKSIVNVPPSIRSWQDFHAAYGPPCAAWRQTLRAYAETDPALGFPTDGKVEIYFDESGANREKMLPGDVRTRVNSILDQTDPGCSKLGEQG